MSCSGELIQKVRKLHSTYLYIHFKGLTIGEFLSENVSKPLGARVFIGEGFNSHSTRHTSPQTKIKHNNFLLDKCQTKLGQEETH